MQTLTIGRDASNNIVLDDNFISRQHARLFLLDNGQVMIKDMGSSNGTFVNGKKITEHYLQPGDELKCGKIKVNWQQYAKVAPPEVKPNPVYQQPPVQPQPQPKQYAEPVYTEPPPIPQQQYIQPQVQQPQYTPPPPPQYQPQQQAPIQQNVIIMGNRKSVGTAFLLAFFFGPLGLLYASVIGGVVMFFISILLFFVLFVIGSLISWIICIIWAVVAASGANRKMSQPVQFIQNQR